ncbi:hypothetical protein OPT61_g6807 [Boeremia exigua]|uniref:Uncharacterized protein n=1 Tax=Boeremia exigua TaxID=749465 RepID=A0ACC2I4R6_9PLEO|nr:hypothetical protein OPT61_g6807 [Boeremia exigua]
MNRRPTEAAPLQAASVQAAVMQVVLSLFNMTLCTKKRVTSRSARFPFLDLPPELRNDIYMYHIDATVDKREVDWATLCNLKGTIPRDTLALSRACRQIRKEYMSLWNAKVTVRVVLFQLERYLNKFYLRHEVAHFRTNIDLTLRGGFEQCHGTLMWADITKLFRSMVRDENLKCKIKMHAKTKEAALEGAQELEEILNIISRSAVPFLDSIVAVRLSMRPEPPPRSTPDDPDNPPPRALIHFTFQEHQTIPGEWPWYGAYDLNKESLLLWKKWLEGLGIPDLQKWHIEFAAQPPVRDNDRSILTWIDGLGYTTSQNEWRKFKIWFVLQWKCNELVLPELAKARSMPFAGDQSEGGVGVIFVARSYILTRAVPATESLW